MPIYVAEVSPSSLRGQTGAFHNLLTTVGIVVAQVLGFREILGRKIAFTYCFLLEMLNLVISDFEHRFFGNMVVVSGAARRAGRDRRFASVCKKTFVVSLH